MEHGFWLDKWERGEIGFHREEVHANLVRELEWFEAGQPGHVLVPLCGKSRDLFFLASRGHGVIGVELSEIACRALFDREGLVPEQSERGPFQAWSAGGVTVLQGDIFELRPEHVPDANRIWDRASMIALPPQMRRTYVTKLRDVMSAQTEARMLLNTLEYTTGTGLGPPFNVTDEEVFSSYRDFGVSNVHTDDQSDQIRPAWRERGVRSLVVRVYRIGAEAVRVD